MPRRAGFRPPERPAPRSPTGRRALIRLTLRPFPRDLVDDRRCLRRSRARRRSAAAGCAARCRRRSGKQTLAAQFRDEIAGRQLDCSGCRADSPSRATRRTVWVGRDQRFEPAPQQPRRPLTRSKKPGSSITSSTALPARHRHRVAAEGRAVGAGDHAAGRLFGRQTGADREPVPERLRHRHDVRRRRPPIHARTAGRCGPCRTAPRHRRAAARTRRRSSRSPFR